MGYINSPLLGGSHAHPIALIQAVELSDSFHLDPFFALPVSPIHKLPHLTTVVHLGFSRGEREDVRLGAASPRYWGQ